MSEARNKGTQIKNTLGEFAKAYYVYDASDRITDTYVATLDTEDGGVCVRTQFTYVGASSLVEKFKESEDTWQTAWEL